MRKYLFLLLISTTIILRAQKVSLLYDFNFTEINLKEILSSVENTTDYYFYYQEQWLNDNELISKAYSKKTIEFILTDLLKDTDLNFYLGKNDKVFITQSTIIYDELPEGFFKENSEKGKIEKQSTPLFLKETQFKKNQAIRIGKVNKDSNVVNEFNVIGSIISLQTNKPVANIFVLINGINRGDRTDDEGDFTLKLPKGNYTLELNSELIENVKRNLVVYNNGNFKLYVNENIEQLKEVIIDGEDENTVKEVVTKTTINVENSKNIPLVLGERDILKVSTSLPGITTAGEGAVGYNVRGGKTDQNLILLDEAVVYNPQHFFGIFSALNPFAIGNVSIYKSGIPAKYGGRLSSVFDLETKDANVKEFSGEASLGPVTGNVLIETPVLKEKSGLMIGGRGAYADWILENLDNKSLKNSQASFFDVVSKYNHKLTDKAKIQATAYWSKDNFNVTTDSIYSYSNKLISLKWDQKINKKHNAFLAISNSNYTFGIEYDGLSNNDFKFSYGINETDAKIQFKYLHSKKIKFEYGISSKIYTVNPGEQDALNLDSIIEYEAVAKEKGLESAFFISSNIDLTKNISIDAGLRYSVFYALGESTQSIYRSSVPKSEATVINNKVFGNNEIFKTYGNPEFRLSGRYSINDSFSLKTSYGRTVQYIHTLSNNTTASPVDIWKLSDINVKPQSSDQFSLGIFKNLKDDLYEVSLEGFYKKSKNVLDFKTGTEIFLNQEIETEILQGEGKSYGVEFLVKKEKGRFNGWLSYTYSRSLIKLDSEFQEEKINGGKFFSSNFDKPHDLSIVANYKITKRYSFSSNFAYQTGRPITYPVGTFNFNNSEFTVYSDRNKFRIPDYYRLDIGFNIEGNHKLNKIGHSFWTISVYNVLGRNNPFSVFFVTQEGEVKAYQSSIFSVPVPSITYSFKF